MIRIPGIPARRSPWLPVDLGLRPGEKVVAFAERQGADGATHVLATARALYVESPAERLAWHRISKATWDEPVLTLTVLDEVGRVDGTRRLVLDVPRDVPAAVFDRVTTSVLAQERVELASGRGASLIARRDSDTGLVRWTVVFDVAADAADPVLRAEADAVLADLRASLGV